jgi:hypothetical protein
MRILAAFFGWMHGITASSVNLQHRCNEEIGAYADVHLSEQSDLLRKIDELATKLAKHLGQGKMSDGEARFCILAMMIGTKGLREGGRFKIGALSLYDLLSNARRQAKESSGKRNSVDFDSLVVDAVDVLLSEGLLSQYDISYIQGTDGAENRDKERTAALTSDKLGDKCIDAVRERTSSYNRAGR